MKLIKISLIVLSSLVVFACGSKKNIAARTSTTSANSAGEKRLTVIHLIGKPSCDDPVLQCPVGTTCKITNDTRSCQ